MKLHVILSAVPLGFVQFVKELPVLGFVLGSLTVTRGKQISQISRLVKNLDFVLRAWWKALGLAFADGIGTCIPGARACVHACGRSTQLPETLPGTSLSAGTERKFCCILDLVRPTRIESDDSRRHSWWW